jgi:hypothetical protein
MATRKQDSDRSAAGMDYDFPIGEKATQLGQTLAENGPEALFDELENLLPESWQEHIRTFPLAAVLVGVGVGVFLGMRKGDEILAAGTAMVTTAAMQNVHQVMQNVASGPRE